MRVLNRSRQNDRLRVMLALVHIDITPPHTPLPVLFVHHIRGEHIVEVEIGGVVIYLPFGEFRRANSYCHLYGAQGQGQLATMNFVGLDLTTPDRWH
ncbi:hypothetical protein TNCV_1170981 [Trichonephila clavipes]|nr:hypothetical protein TNCV_1170981 [Trichonephila clavipes]